MDQCFLAAFPWPAAPDAGRAAEHQLPCNAHFRFRDGPAADEAAFQMRENLM